MIQLNGNTHKLQCVMSGAAATTNPDFWASWMQLNASALDNGDAAGGTLNGTTDVDLVTGVASRQLIVKSLHVYNRDTAAVTLTFKMDVSGTERFLYKCTLQTGESVSYGEAGWQVRTAAGVPVTAPAVVDSIADADTVNAPSRNAVFDALALKQPLDSDLTAIAALTTTSLGRSLLTGADEEALRDLLRIGPRWCYEAIIDFGSGNFGANILNTEWVRSVSGTGALVNLKSGLTSGNSYGRAVLALGTTTTGRSAVTQYTNAHTLGAGRVQFNLKGQLDSLSDGTDTYVQFMGMMGDEAAEPNNGCYFRYTHSVNSGKWECVTRSGGVETATDSGVTAVAGTERVWQVVVNAAATSVGFYIDGVLVQTHITNIPTSKLGGCATAIRSAGTAAKNALAMDVIHVRVDFTTPRW